MREAAASTQELGSLTTGGGAGADVLISARRVGPTGKAIGLDMIDEMLDLARRNATDALGVDRSQLLREALHRHLVGLRGELDASRWVEAPATEAELSLAAIADWGPAEDWADWDDAAR